MKLQFPAVNKMERYSRQMLFAPFQNEGQDKLLNSSVLVVGVGALGTSVVEQLARAGVGHITIVDRDYVELSNLQRQTLFTEEDVKLMKPKAVAAQEKIKQINSSIKVESYVEHVSKENIEKFIKEKDIIFDGTDNFSTRYLLNDIAYKYNIPFIYGGVISSRGMSAIFIPNKTPCFRCLMKDNYSEGQTCDTVGVINPAVNIVTSLQVTEALKYLTGNMESLHGGLISFDVWNNQFNKIKFTKVNPECRTCQLEEFPTLYQKDDIEESVLCGRNTIQIQHHKTFDLTLWKERLSKVAKVTETPFLLKVEVARDITFILFPDGRLLVQGTEDVVKARSLYDRYIGT